MVSGGDAAGTAVRSFAGGAAVRPAASRAGRSTTYHLAGVLQAGEPVAADRACLIKRSANVDEGGNSRILFPRRLHTQVGEMIDHVYCCM